MSEEENSKKSIPVGDLGIIGMKGCEDFVDKVNNWIITWRKESGAYEGGSYTVEADWPRFGSGEGKGMIKESVRGHDLYIISDIFNYGAKYKMYDIEVPMSPDDHFQDLKRIISAAGGKARRINVIMPMLYEGRQHKRTGRESLDCAMALRELGNMGVDNIITFDAHDPRVQNAVPLTGFENVHPTYQMLKALVHTEDNLHIDREHMAIVSPDEGGLSRCIYYSSVLGLELGMFYKRRDYTRVVNGRNPIISHEYLGGPLKGKDIILVDDIIASGDSMLDIAQQLRKMDAGRVFIFATFGLFCEGLEKFDEAYRCGCIEKVYTTNLVYRPNPLKSREWYAEVDMSKYVSYIIDTLNYDRSISNLLTPVYRIHKLLSNMNK